MGDYELYSGLSDRISSVESEFGEAVSAIANRVREGFSTLDGKIDSVRREINAVSRRVDGLETELEETQETVEAIAQALSGYASQIQSISGSMEAGSDAVSELDGLLQSEASREEEQRRQIASQLEELRGAQQALTELWRGGFAEVEKRLAALRTKESELQEAVKGAADRMTGLLAEQGEQLGSQVRGVNEGLGQLAEDERAGIYEITKGFEELQEMDAELGEWFKAIRNASGRAAATLKQLAGDEVGMACERARRKAVALNASGLQLLSSGQPEAAAECFRQAAACAVDILEPRFNLVVALQGAGKVEEARREAGALLEQHGGRDEARFLAGALSLLAGEVPQAAAVLSTPASEAPQGWLAAAAVADLFSGSAGSAHARLAEALREGAPAAQLLAGMGFGRVLARP